MKFSFAIIAAATAVSAVDIAFSHVLQEGQVAYRAKNEQGQNSVVILEAPEESDEKAKRWHWLDWRMFEPIC
ncbi:hypothetical protein DICA3_C10374 [Diutina catenulata]